MSRLPSSRKPRRPDGTEGFTLTELLVVLGIVALLAALVAPQVVRYLGKARSDTATAQIRNIEGALELYYLDVGSYPSASDGLDALFTAPANAASWKGPYLKQRDGLIDPWGKPYLYQSPGQHGDFDISSLGRDGRENGDGEDADITSW
ncbi:type II secretion system major pseudopilin GspG [Taklimakanibacter lacteus]|uniref:type II secretion system major pseudopilin GspG n=1 Tax=Taklimakanibacter lacteus TaxID=2268456 RepID=UPI0034D6A23A